MNATKPIHTLNQTREIAQRLGERLRCGDVVTVAGVVGAGKTTFAQFLIKALSGEGVEVTSPTFTILQTYPVTLANGANTELYHYDLYRIEHESALIELGLEDAMAQVILLEWPERLGHYPLPITLALSLTLGEDGARTISAQSDDNRFKDLLK